MIDFPTPRVSEEDVATPFESWCEQMHIHPEAFGAWERYEHQVPQRQGRRERQPA